MKVYVDDMVVESANVLDHLAHVKKIFNKGGKHNMRLNQKKVEDSSTS